MRHRSIYREIRDSRSGTESRSAMPDGHRLLAEDARGRLGRGRRGQRSGRRRRGLRGSANRARRTGHSGPVQGRQRLGSNERGGAAGNSGIGAPGSCANEAAVPSSRPMAAIASGADHRMLRTSLAHFTVSKCLSVERRARQTAAAKSGSRTSTVATPLAPYRSASALRARETASPWSSRSRRRPPACRDCGRAASRAWRRSGRRSPRACSAASPASRLSMNPSPRLSQSEPRVITSCTLTRSQ